MNRREFTGGALGVAVAALATSASGSSHANEPSPKSPHPLLTTTHPAIARSRDVALDVLKPKTADLEHGLELHRDSVVFDSYGFAPRAASDTGKILAAMEAGASDAELQDLQEDHGMTRAASDAAERAEFEESMRTSGVTAIFQNAGEEGNDPLRLLKRLARFTSLIDSLPGTLLRAATPATIEAAKKANQHCLYLTGNGVPLPQQWMTVEEELAYIRIFFQLGIRMMHVTYNRRNPLGDGCAESANGGLSDLGRAAVREMNRVGVIVDVAHSGWQTSLEAAKASERPMVASHTTCNTLQNHIRAKPDDVIAAICDTGGLIGLCCIPTFLGGTGDIAALLDHIDHAVKKFGVDHVAIGTDVAHTSQHASKPAVKLPSRGKRRTRYESLWPPNALGGNWPRAASLAWTNWPLFTVGLVQRGHSDEAIQKILGGNMLRVCREALRGTT